MQSCCLKAKSIWFKLNNLINKLLFDYYIFCLYEILIKFILWLKIVQFENVKTIIYVPYLMNSHPH